MQFIAQNRRNNIKLVWGQLNLLHRLLALPGNRIRMRQKHLPGELQKISTEAQSKGYNLAQRDARTIVWGWSRPMPCSGEHGLEHSRRQGVLPPSSAESVLHLFGPALK